MNENNEFFQPDNEFSKLMKKARRKSLLRSILISISVTSLFFGGLFWFGTYRMDQQVTEAIANDGYWQFVKGANVESHGSMVSNTPFFKTVTTEQNKEIAGVVIPWGQHVKTFSVFGASPAVQASTISSSNTKDGRNTLYFQGERVVEFYYPTVTYPSLPDDRNILDQIPEHLVMEMAFSFDQAYSINEVRKKFSEQLAWYWVDSASPSEKDNVKQPISGNDAYGFISRTEEMNEDAAKRFIQQVKWLQKKGEAQQEAHRLYDVLTDSGSTELSSENLKITGAVVTGTAEELKKFNEEPMIRAAVLGATANNY